MGETIVSTNNGTGGNAAIWLMRRLRREFGLEFIYADLSNTATQPLRIGISNVLFHVSRRSGRALGRLNRPICLDRFLDLLMEVGIRYV